MKACEIKAIDYYPSVADMLIDHWRRVSAEEIRSELSALKARRPDCNAIRITHSFEAFQRGPKEYARRFEERLAIADRLGLKVISCLFNRYHDAKRDCGGTYLEQLIPDFSWAYADGYYERFMQEICLAHSEDPRVLIWETCGKPLGVYRQEAEDPILATCYEKRWLRELYCYIKKCEVQQPVGISCRHDYAEETLAYLLRCCDLLILSPYYGNEAMSQCIRGWSPRQVSLPVIRVSGPDEQHFL